MSWIHHRTDSSSWLSKQWAASDEYVAKLPLLKPQIITASCARQPQTAGDNTRMEVCFLVRKYGFYAGVLAQLRYMRLRMTNAALRRMRTKHGGLALLYHISVFRLFAIQRSFSVNLTSIKHAHHRSDRSLQGSWSTYIAPAPPSLHPRIPQHQLTHPHSTNSSRPSLPAVIR